MRRCRFIKYRINSCSVGHSKLTTFRRCFWQISIQIESGKDRNSILKIIYQSKLVYVLYSHKLCRMVGDIWNLRSSKIKKNSGFTLNCMQSRGGEAGTCDARTCSTARVPSRASTVGALIFSRVAKEESAELTDHCSLPFFFFFIT